MSDLHLAIVTPEGTAFDGPITLVMAPGVNGNFTVLRGHAPMITALEAGVVRVQDATGELYFVVDGGFFEVRANDAVVLANWSEPAPDAQRAAEAVKTRRATAKK
ncbi:MAG: ATP synthase F1 subunit epsilon [Verrucomicrobia bacterium]|nr:ATP synthase F1 subunit epsilon [Verrucomicrobiota bacterium]